MGVVIRQIKQSVGEKSVFFTFDIEFVDPTYSTRTWEGS
jgi:arginase family enzyme